MEGIRGFIRISDGLSCAGQPTEKELAEVRGGEVKFVLNLAMSDSDFALQDEQAAVESLGMDYVHIPVPFSAPTIEHFLQFEKELLHRHEQRTLVHCAYNWRASSFAAMYAERHLGWTRERADALRCALWSPDATWTAWANSVRALS